MLVPFRLGSQGETWWTSTNGEVTMVDDGTTVVWTEEEVSKRLNGVRSALLEFLKERTRLDWFKHKARWRLSRAFIWPGAPVDFKQRLDEAVEHDVGVEAFMAHLEKQKRTISNAMERYDTALRRWFEQMAGCRVEEFDTERRAALRSRRINFARTRDELLECAGKLTPDAAREPISELLSLRLAVLNEDARDQLFAEVSATQAALMADEDEKISHEEQEILAFEIEQRLRCLDRYHVAALLAVSYPEARRLMQIDHLLDQYQNERDKSEQTAEDPYRERRIAAIRGVLLNEIGFLEKVFPHSKETHDRELALLRGGAVSDPPDGQI